MLTAVHNYLAEADKQDGGYCDIGNPANTDRA